jgi:hypothetical protein
MNNLYEEFLNGVKVLSNFYCNLVAFNKIMPTFVVHYGNETIFTTKFYQAKQLWLNRFDRSISFT